MKYKILLLEKSLEKKVNILVNMYIFSNFLLCQLSFLSGTSRRITTASIIWIMCRPVGPMILLVALLFTLGKEFVRLYLSKLKSNKNNKIWIVTKSKLNSIKSTISKAMLKFYNSEKVFNKEWNADNKLKEEIKKNIRSQETGF